MIQSLGPTPTYFGPLRFFLTPHCYAFSPTTKEKPAMRGECKHQVQGNPAKFTMTWKQLLPANEIPAMLHAHGEKKPQTQKDSAVATAVTATRLRPGAHYTKHCVRGGRGFDGVDKKDLDWRTSFRISCQHIFIQNSRFWSIPSGSIPLPTA